MKTKVKNPDPVRSDPALEAQIKDRMENPPVSTQPTQAIVPIGDARVEQIKKSNGVGDRLAVRAANGKFTKLATAVAAKDARQAQEFLLGKVTNEAGVELSRKQHLREALYSGAITASREPRALGNATKAFEALNEDAALTQAKESMLSDDSNVQNPIRVVVINVPEGIKMMEEKPPTPKQPSWAASEVVYTNPPRE